MTAIPDAPLQLPAMLPISPRRRDGSIRRSAGIRQRLAQYPTGLEGVAREGAARLGPNVSVAMVHGR